MPESKVKHTSEFPISLVSTNLHSIVKVLLALLVPGQYVREIILKGFVRLSDRKKLIKVKARENLNAHGQKTNN